jgi:hypothetical protein
VAETKESLLKKINYAATNYGGDVRKRLVNKYKADLSGLIKRESNALRDTQTDLSVNPGLAEDRKWVMKRVLMGDKSPFIKELFTRHFPDHKEASTIAAEVIKEEKAKAQWAHIRAISEFKLS